MKSNKQVKFGYMTRYDPSVIFLKKYLIIEIKWNLHFEIDLGILVMRHMIS